LPDLLKKLCLASVSLMVASEYILMVGMCSDYNYECITTFMNIVRKEGVFTNR
jgi:hypothetical protein